MMNEQDSLDSNGVEEIPDLHVKNAEAESEPHK